MWTKEQGFFKSQCSHLCTGLASPSMDVPIDSNMQAGKLETKAGIWAGISLPRCVTHPTAPGTFSVLLLKNWEVWLAVLQRFSSHLRGHLVQSITLTADGSHRSVHMHPGMVKGSDAQEWPRTGSKGLPSILLLLAEREKPRFSSCRPDGRMFLGAVAVPRCRGAARRRAGVSASPGARRDPAEPGGSAAPGEMLRHRGEAREAPGTIPAASSPA